jgi:prepilin-type N-terminal cleavage/methylation domain-containing protein
MKKKGFTLVELLAVIVILAVIALIATPSVLKMIEQSR